MSSRTIPTFVLPYKRYAASSLLALVEEYVEQDDASYRSTVRDAVADRKDYLTPDGKHLPGDHGLHHSTLWRALSWLGSLDTSLRCAIDLILHRDSTSKVHRFSGAVAAGKFHSSAREQLLRTARRLLHVMAEFQQLFKSPFFPRFATAAGGG
jgi:hypothetical protein